MPLYEYLCDNCEHRFEVIQKFSDALVSTCPECGGTVTKQMSSPAIQFKGTGWYITDYARKPSGGEPSSKSDTAQQKDAASEKNEKKKSDSTSSSSTSSSTSSSSSSSSRDK
jgi:putative FmdB family regulatory protein